MFRKLRSRAIATEKISQLLGDPEEIARRSGLDRPDTGISFSPPCNCPTGRPRRAFERLGATGADFAAALKAQETHDLGSIGVHAQHDRTELPAPTTPTGVYRGEPSAQQLFQLAGEDARRGGGTLLGAHMVRAAARLEHGLTARALSRMRIDPSDLSEAASAEIVGNGTA